MNLQLLTITLAAILIGGINASPGNDEAIEECGGGVATGCEHTHTDEEGEKTKHHCNTYTSGPNHVSYKGPSGIHAGGECFHTYADLPDGSG